MAARNHVELVEKTLRVLEALADGPGTSTLRDIASQTGLVKSSAFRILFTLKELGYVDQVGPGRYRLTLKTLALARRAVSRPSLVNVARPHLAQARDEILESIWLAEWRRDNVILVEVTEAPQRLRLSLDLGDICPLHASALGKAVAAHLLPEELKDALGEGPLPRYTARTITSRSRLAQELQRVREQGYSVNDEETIEGALLIGAPVFDLRGHACAAVSASAPTVRCTAPKRQQMIRAVTGAAAAITRDLKAIGFQTPWLRAPQVAG
jgi:DNA-binding IclR family transcriptional regulator